MLLILMTTSSRRTQPRRKRCVSEKSQQENTIFDLRCALIYICGFTTLKVRMSVAQKTGNLKFDSHHIIRIVR